MVYRGDAWATWSLGVERIGVSLYRVLLVLVA